MTLSNPTGHLLCAFGTRIYSLQKCSFFVPLLSLLFATCTHTGRDHKAAQRKPWLGDGLKRRPHKAGTRILPLWVFFSTKGKRTNPDFFCAPSPFFFIVAPARARLPRNLVVGRPRRQDRVVISFFCIFSLSVFFLVLLQAKFFFCGDNGGSVNKPWTKATMERTESSDGNRLADQDESDVATLAGVIGQEDADGNETDRDYDNKGEGGGDGVGGDDGGSDDDDDCLLFPETPEDELDEAHEAQCRRAYVAACGPGVPVFLAGARPRADKGWAWLLAAASGAPAQGRASVGRIDYGPHRFYVGDVNARGLPEGYGAVVHTRSDAFAPKKNVATTDANALGTPCRWPAPWALLKWHEGFWRAGQREGDGISVCLEYKVATEGRWRCDLLDGHGRGPMAAADGPSCPTVRAAAAGPAATSGVTGAIGGTASGTARASSRSPATRIP